MSESYAPLLVGTLRGLPAIREYARSRPASRAADLVEMRLDLMPRAAWEEVFAACDQLQATGTKVLCTIRMAADGGKWTQDEAKRLPLFMRALDHCSWVDVELGSAIAGEVCAEAHRRGKKVVASLHDFAGTPRGSSLERAYAKGIKLGADVVKFATMVTRHAHHEALTGVVRKFAKGQRICAMGMGAFGLPLRIYLPAIGSVFAYSYLDAEAAPGQLSCAQMLEVLRLQLPRFNERYLARTAARPA